MPTYLSETDKHAQIDVTPVGAAVTATRSATGSPAWRSARGTTQHSTGRYYFEVELINETGNGIIFGVANAAASLGNYIGVDANGSSFQADTGSALSSWIDGVYGGSYLATVGVPDIVGVYIDLDSNVFMARDVTGGGAWGVRKTLSANLFGTTAVYPAVSLFQTGNAATFNFGASPFLGAIPTVQQSWDQSQTGLYIPGWDPMHKHDAFTLSSGNLLATIAGGTLGTVRSMEGLRNGPGGENDKIYFEIKLSQFTGGNLFAGLCNSTTGTADTIKNHAGAWCVSTTDSGAFHLGTGYIIANSLDGHCCIAWDRATGGVWLKNQVSPAVGWVGGGDPVTGATPTFIISGTDVLYPCASVLGNTNTARLYLDGFVGGIPAGYVGLGDAIVDEPPDEILTPPTTGGGGLPISEELAAYLGLPPKPAPPPVQLTNFDGTPTRAFHDYLTKQYEWERRLYVVLTEG